MGEIDVRWMKQDEPRSNGSREVTFYGAHHEHKKAMEYVLGQVRDFMDLHPGLETREPVEARVIKGRCVDRHNKVTDRYGIEVRAVFWKQPQVVRAVAEQMPLPTPDSATEDIHWLPSTDDRPKHHEVPSGHVHVDDRPHVDHGTNTAWEERGRHQLTRSGLRIRRFEELPLDQVMRDDLEIAMPSKGYPTRRPVARRCQNWSCRRWFKHEARAVNIQRFCSDACAEEGVDQDWLLFLSVRESLDAGRTWPVDDPNVDNISILDWVQVLREDTDGKL